MPPKPPFAPPNLKRKQHPTSQTQIFIPRNAKRAKTISARTILAQSSEKALNENGDLDVAAFVKAREFEIKALENGMKSSKNSGASRAFQQVPRELRRRTASHNVKKVPKRLRARAAKEMKDDNTPTVTPRSRNPTAHMRLRLANAKKLRGIRARGVAKKAAARAATSTEDGENSAETVDEAASKVPILKKNMLLSAPTPPAKFRKRQIHKSWLPTHLFHTKRAQMTKPNDPLWRFAIPLTPSEKSYRVTHRAGTLRGCVAWDMSYVSTIGVDGVEESIIGLLEGIGVPETILAKSSATKWRSGTRFWSGWVRDRDNAKTVIAKVELVWSGSEQSAVEELRAQSSNSKPKKKKMLIRVHPSAFLQLWNEILKVAKMQRPMLSVEDLRFEIGSIEIMGPGATEALVGVLHNAEEDNVENVAADDHGTIWPSLAAVSNPGSLPMKALLGFEVLDSRIRHPPRTIKIPSTPSDNNNLLQILSSWPPDNMRKPISFFDRKARLMGSKLPSQQSINRRKGSALAGAYPTQIPADPKIPILLLASRAENGTHGQGSWTLLLHWKCVSTVWSSLMYYPLSSGGTPRFGGLQEKRQISFEQGVPWFPGDYPGTKAGWQWELSEREKRKAEWEKQPRGKRVEWDSLDLGEGRNGEIGRGWACDWERLLHGSSALPTEGAIPENTNETEPSAKPPFQTPPLDIWQLIVPRHSSLPTPISPTALTAVKLTVLHRGVPTACARIYRLPTTSPSLLAQWLALAGPRSPKAQKNVYSFSHPNTYNPRALERRAMLAASILQPADHESKAAVTSNKLHPAIPAEEDLIGFVTTGNFNLGEGQGTGIGCILLARACEDKPRRQELCILREAGTALGRLARWEMV